ncbi:hypothetical protein AAFF_G00316560, partial [Aldrovandia affinis]
MHNPPFSSQHSLGFDCLRNSSEGGSRKRQWTPFKMNPRDTESSDEPEEEEERPLKTMDLFHLPYLSPQYVLDLSPNHDPDMTDLSQIQFYRTLGRFNSMQVKREPASLEALWSPSPLLMLPSHPYIAPLHPSWISLSFFMPRPVMHLSPHNFYQEALLRHRRGLGRARGVQTPAVKHNLGVHVDESYHVDVGTNQKRWQCRLCEKSYTSKYNLVTHILGHSGIKPHGCGQCGKLFKQLSHLHTHMLTHQGTRPHKCQACHKAFTQTSHLKRHMMQHSDI